MKFYTLFTEIEMSAKSLSAALYDVVDGLAMRRRHPIANFAMYSDPCIRKMSAISTDSGKREFQMGAPLGRKNENWVAMSGPELSYQLQSSGRKRDKSIFGALAVPDMNHVAISIDVLNLKMSSLLKSKSAGVYGSETETVAGKFDEEKNASNFLRRKNDGKLLFFRWANEIESGKTLVKNVQEKESDAAKSDGGGTAGVFLFISEVKEVLSNFLI